MIGIWRQRGRVVRAPDLKSGDPEFKSRPDHQLDLFQVEPGSTPRLRSYCLLPVGILNLLSLFQWFVSLALKSPSEERSIKYTYIHTYNAMSRLINLMVLI